MNTLKLNKIESNRLDENKMNYIRGGQGTKACSCGCQYENKGGSSTGVNCSANAKTGKQAPAGVDPKCWEGPGTVRWI